MKSQVESGNCARAFRASEVQNFIQELSGFKPSRSALWRWHLSGRLECKRIGGRIYSTEDAIRKMLANDEQCNRGSVESRGQLAGERIAKIARARKARRS